ncbi:MAG TPA: prepilin-type N-terminal cleavage/methylation domain-containing protein [Thermodesulfovibrionales bacterium]|nr:prepilin-type N-terminal cleavage/methylation domain-containing protein [Thermodesulfovibrionales bacterium]
MRTEKGLTLIEVMIALVVFLFVSLALMQTALLSIDSNMISALRDEGVKVAEQRMNDARSLPFHASNDMLTGASDVSSLSAANCPSSAFRASFPTGVAVQRNVRSISNFSFCTNMTVTPIPSAINPTSARVTVTAGWQWRGQDYSHSISTIIMREL